MPSSPALPRILFIKAKNSSFVVQDEEMLRKHFRVESFEFGSRKGLDMLRMQWKLFFWVLARIGKSAGCFVWFADYHSYFPALLSRVRGKKCWIVIGGYDAEKRPDLGYGAFLKKTRAWFVRKSCRHATALLAVSAFTKGRLSLHTRGRYDHKVKLVHNGVDPAHFRRNATLPQLNRALCVAAADNQTTALVKGVDLFIQTAALKPELEFRIIGVQRADAEKWFGHLPGNLTLLPAIPRSALVDEYSQSKWICVFSRLESFGMVMAEAMLCECVPVTWPGTGAAEMAADGAGIMAGSQDPQAFADCLSLPVQPGAGAAARAHVLARYSLEGREQLLAAILKG